MTETPTIAPVVRTIEVAAPVETAFALFTAHIGRWWPVAGGHSVFGEGALVAFEGEELVERYGDQRSVWAEVVEWDPPQGFRLTWHPGSGPERSTDVRVDFAPTADGTTVTLVHSGWERLAEADAMRSNYDTGWAYVLGWYGTDVAGVVGDVVGAGGPPGADGAEVGEWFALRHSPGPSLADGESIFDTEAFAEHVAFLRRLSDRGLLVAAGPIPSAAGEGMTIVRVLPEHGDVDVAALATVDDQCVATGYLVVDVQPWAVRFTG